MAAVGWKWLQVRWARTQAHALPIFFSHIATSSLLLPKTMYICLFKACTLYKTVSAFSSWAIYWPCSRPSCWAAPTLWLHPWHPSRRPLRPASAFSSQLGCFSSFLKELLGGLYHIFQGLEHCLLIFQALLAQVWSLLNLFQRLPQSCSLCWATMLCPSWPFSRLLPGWNLPGGLLLHPC